MPQVQLPLFPAGTTHRNEDLAFECHDAQVTYFNGHLPVFTHAQDDLAAFYWPRSKTIARHRDTRERARVLDCASPDMLSKVIHHRAERPRQGARPKVVNNVAACYNEGGDTAF